MRCGGHIGAISRQDPRSERRYAYRGSPRPIQRPSAPIAEPWALVAAIQHNGGPLEKPSETWGGYRRGTWRMRLKGLPRWCSTLFDAAQLLKHKAAGAQKAGRIGTSPLKRFAWSSQRKTVKRLYNGPTNIRVFSDLMRSVGLITQSYLS